MHTFRQYWQQMVLFAVFAVWLPLQKGLSFLDPIVLGAYACLGVIFAAPAAASGIPVLRAVRNGLAHGWLMLVVGMCVIFFSRNVVVGPDLRSLAECGLFGAALSLAVASMASFTAQRASVSAAKIVARLLLLALLVLFYFWSGWLPNVALRGAAVCAGITAVFMILSRR